MENYLVDENVICENPDAGMDKKKIILFSVLAVFVPFVIENLLTIAVYEIMSRNINLSSTVMAGTGAFISFLAATIRLVILVLCGYNITRSKEGTVRFAGIFMFSVAIASNLIGIFNFVEHLPLQPEIIAWIMLVFKGIAAVFGAVIFIKLFSIFEYRTENRYVKGAEASLFRKRMLILLVLTYAISFVSSGIVPYFSVALGTTMEDIQIILYVISIGGFLLGMLMLYLIYRLSLSVRNVKSDAIGFGAAYYIPGVVTAPVTLLINGLLQVLISADVNNAIAIIQGFITMAISLITTIVSIFIIFTVLKIFFPVKEEAPIPESKDRAEEILQNLIESEKNTDTEE